MKSDLTRSTFRRENHYSGVRMQQGRVQIDADWNEQVDIAAYLDETTRIDVIGRCGMPVHDAGFGVTVMPEGDDLALSPGRAYVGGIPCENDGTPIRILVIDDSELGLDGVVADGRELREGEWVELSATGVDPIWRRIDAVDAKSWAVRLEPMLDPAAQKALADAGDAGLRRLTTYLTQPSFPGDPSAASHAMPEAGLYLVYLDAWQRHRTALEDGSLREVALGGPDHATRTQTVWQVRRTLLGEETTCESLPSWGEIAPRTTGRLRARAHPETTADDPCTIPPGAGFRRGEDQLYRVEIVTSGELGTAEFTYSRENGSVAVPWLDSDNGTMTVTTIGRDAVLGFGPGDWVELTDDTRELAGEAGTLAKVKTANGKVLALHTGPPDPPTGSLDIADFNLNPKVRRWDDPKGKRTVEMATDNDGFLVLEDGVEVRFEDGHYRALDYWLIPARTALGDVEWSVDSAGTPLAMPPDGVAHQYCALALLRFDEQWDSSSVKDCRKLFPPLTEIGGAAPEEGVHVVAITAHEAQLQNDGPITPDQLADGIEIHCDRDVESATLRRKPTCLVTVDLPFPVNEADQALWGDRIVGSTPVTLAADVSASGPTIRWTPAGGTRDWLSDRVGKILAELEVPEVLVHLLLRGRFVHEAGSPTLNVDGEAFGVLAGGRLDVALPSGDGRRGGDLELWFWLRNPGDGGHFGLVLAVPIASMVLTSGASRSAVSTAISAVLPRTALLEALPAGFEVDLDAVPDPPRARGLLASEGLAEPGAAPTLVLAVEEALVGAVDVVTAALHEHDLPLGLEVLVVSSAADLADRLAGEKAPDLILVSQESFDLLARSAPGSIAPEGTIPL
jgi:hypothetical protein